MKTSNPPSRSDLVDIKSNGVGAEVDDGDSHGEFISVMRGAGEQKENRD
jgi:hypothetical protein